MTLFIPALPIACAFALFTNTLKCKVNAWKLFTLYQRPIPQGAEDIGSWLGVFEFISKLSVVTNGALICFTADIIPTSFFGKSCLFVVFQWTLITLQYCIDIMIPDTPKEVLIQLARVEYIVSKLIHSEADDIYDPLKTLNSPITDPEEDEVTVLLKKLEVTTDEVTDVPIDFYPRNLPRSRWPKSVEVGSMNCNEKDHNLSCSSKEI